MHSIVFIHLLLYGLVASKPPDHSASKAVVWPGSPAHHPNRRYVDLNTAPTGSRWHAADSKPLIRRQGPVWKKIKDKLTGKTPSRGGKSGSKGRSKSSSSQTEATSQGTKDTFQGAADWPKTPKHRGSFGDTLDPLTAYAGSPNAKDAFTVKSDAGLERYDGIHPSSHEDYSEYMTGAVRPESGYNTGLTMTRYGDSDTKPWYETQAADSSRFSQSSAANKARRPSIVVTDPDHVNSPPAYSPDDPYEEEEEEEEEGGGGGGEESSSRERSLKKSYDSKTSQNSADAQKQQESSDSAEQENSNAPANEQEISSGDPDFPPSSSSKQYLPRGLEAREAAQYGNKHHWQRIVRRTFPPTKESGPLFDFSSGADSGQSKQTQSKVTSSHADVETDQKSPAKQKLPAWPMPSDPPESFYNWKFPKTARVNPLRPHVGKVINKQGTRKVDTSPATDLGTPKARTSEGHDQGRDDDNIFEPDHTDEPPPGFNSILGVFGGATLPPKIGVIKTDRKKIKRRNLRPGRSFPGESAFGQLTAPRWLSRRSYGSQVDSTAPGSTISSIPPPVAPNTSEGSQTTADESLGSAADPLSQPWVSDLSPTNGAGLNRPFPYLPKQVGGLSAPKRPFGGWRRAKELGPLSPRPRQRNRPRPSPAVDGTTDLSDIASKYPEIQFAESFQDETPSSKIAAYSPGQGPPQLTLGESPKLLQRRTPSYSLFPTRKHERRSGLSPLNTNVGGSQYQEDEVSPLAEGSQRPISSYDVSPILPDTQTSQYLGSSSAYGGASSSSSSQPVNLPVAEAASGALTPNVMAPGPSVPSGAAPGTQASGGTVPSGSMAGVKASGNTASIGASLSSMAPIAAAPGTAASVASSSGTASTVKATSRNAFERVSGVRHDLSGVRDRMKAKKFKDLKDREGAIPENEAIAVGVDGAPGHYGPTSYEPPTSREEPPMSEEEPPMSEEELPMSEEEPPMPEEGQAQRPKQSAAKNFGKKLKNAVSMSRLKGIGRKQGGNDFNQDSVYVGSGGEPSSSTGGKSSRFFSSKNKNRAPYDYDQDPVYVPPPSPPPPPPPPPPPGGRGGRGGKGKERAP